MQISAFLLFKKWNDFHPHHAKDDQAGLFEWMLGAIVVFLLISVAGLQSQSLFFDNIYVKVGNTWLDCK